MARHYRLLSNDLAGSQSGIIIGQYLQEYRSSDFNRDYRLLCFEHGFRGHVLIDAQVGMAEVEPIEHDEPATTVAIQFGS